MAAGDRTGVLEKEGHSHHWLAIASQTFVTSSLEWTQMPFADLFRYPVLNFVPKYAPAISGKAPFMLFVV